MKSLKDVKFYLITIYLYVCFISIASIATTLGGIVWHEAVTEKYGYLSFLNERGWLLIVPTLFISFYIYTRELNVQKKYLVIVACITLFLITGSYLG